MAPVDFEAFVDELANVSGTTIMPFFRSALGVEDKSGGVDFDPVTEADRAAEAAIRQKIRATFPTHGVMGEEYGSERLDAEFVWVLDPIDGTKSFISGMVGWGTLIGLLRNGQPCYGMMHQPFTRERFSGDGGSAKYRGPGGERVLRTRPCATLADAVLYTTTPRLMAPAEQVRFSVIEEKVKLSRYGGDCYAYAMLAMGLVDLIIEASLQPYDITALIPIIEGAGGVITTWDGGPAQAGGRIVAAGDARVHAAALALLQASFEA
ncbi:histidinol-phosphatase [Labrys monachus]|uniref:Histidinol-phosphatase n=1 Tax=Labrys monachus TaxID=217067 RepID=A0ABU0FP68_9HYPH|nr:histidinol-phosphatase [Labrys monachus]MDQ0396152.1 myo-inositol-1(or 4)-monophosphatase [Labrys monachus]